MALKSEIPYRRIATTIWNDPKFRSLSDLHVKLFFYVLTCPETNLTGLYVLHPGTLHDAFQVPYKPIPRWFAQGCLDGFEKITDKGLYGGLARLISMEIIEYDVESHLIWVKNFLDYHPIANENIAKNAVKVLRRLPQADLLYEFLNVTEDRLDGAKHIKRLYINHYANPKPAPEIPEPFAKPFHEPFEEPFSKPIAKQSRTKEKEKEKEKENTAEAESSYNPIEEFALGDDDHTEPESWLN